MTRTANAIRTAGRGDLRAQFATVRSFTDELCAPLTPEDCCIQSMPSASPTRWHLAHTSWFFETFLLKADPAYRPFDEHYEVLFNSYYNSVGEQFPRARRGLLSRPSLAEVQDYRRHVDEAVTQFFQSGRVDEDAALANVVVWGLHHEQQHQELILTDVKHLFSVNPLLPAYREAKSGTGREKAQGSQEGEWVEFEAGLREMGHAGAGFAYDNEGPRHRVYLDGFRIARRPVTGGEFLAFIADGGYERPELWLSEGWNFVREQGVARPLYWFEHAGEWQEFTLAGARPLDLAAPASHVSFFEADAYARWAGARLPTEAQWEAAAEGVSLAGHFIDALLEQDLAIHPSGNPDERGSLVQMFGDVWEWTASPYVAYPGYCPPSGALGEYNGKFMCNQYVLRGGSCATTADHIRRTYRNFFPADTRWQFSGFRLAK